MSGTLQALGWTLIHFCWQATAVAALYLAADLWLRKASSHTRYLFTLATLLFMFMAFVVTLGYESIHYSSAISIQANHSPTLTLTPSSIGILAANVELSVKQSAHIQFATILPWIDCAWLFGVIYLSVRSIGGWWWLERLRRRTTLEAPEAIQAAFLKVVARLGISRLPDLRICERISIPMTFGILRSLVLLPASALLFLSPDQLEVVLAHELAHVRRADYFWNLVQTVIESLFFFHPAVWWIGRKLREQRELCCDDMAIELCADPLVYATALLRLEEQRCGGLNLAMALDGHQSRSNFLVRVRRILGETVLQPHPERLRPLSLLMLCAGLFFFATFLPKAAGSVAVQDLLAKEMHTVSAANGFTTKHLALNTPQAQVEKPVPDNADYVKQLRAAGYNAEQGQYVVLQNVGITPAYAKEMAGLGMGQPSVGALLELKKENITRQYLETMRAAGLKPQSFDELISYRLFNITPEFIDQMKAAGFPTISSRELQDLRAVGVTPKYAETMKQQTPNVTVRDLINSRVALNGGTIPAHSENAGTTPPVFLDPALPHPPPHIAQSAPGKSPPLIQQ